MRLILSLCAGLFALACHRERAAPTTPTTQSAPPAPTPAPDVLSPDATPAPATQPDAASAGDVADDGPLSGPLRVGFSYDPGMRHSEVSAVFLRGGAVVAQRPIVRIGGSCRAEDYARLMGHPPTAPVVVAAGCIHDEPDLRVSHVIEVLREGDVLVLRHGDARNRRVARWEEAERVALAPGADVSAETTAAIEAALSHVGP